MSLKYENNPTLSVAIGMKTGIELSKLVMTAVDQLGKRPKYKTVECGII